MILTLPFTCSCPGGRCPPASANIRGFLLCTVDYSRSCVIRVVPFHGRGVGTALASINSKDFLLVSVLCRRLHFVCTFVRRLHQLDPQERGLTRLSLDRVRAVIPAKTRNETLPHSTYEILPAAVNTAQVRGGSTSSMGRRSECIQVETITGLRCLLHQVHPVNGLTSNPSLH